MAAGKEGIFPGLKRLNSLLVMQEECEQKADGGSCSLKQWIISLLMS